MPQEAGFIIGEDIPDNNRNSDESEENLPLNKDTMIIVSPPPVITAAPPPPPPPPFSPHSSTFTPFIDVPDPKQKMKTLSWRRITDMKDKSVWAEMKGENGSNAIDYEKLETLFSCKEVKIRQSSKCVKTYLDSKKAMRIAIFLRKFKRTPDKVVDLIFHGITKEMEYHSFRALKEHLPSKDEIESLKEVCEEDMSTLSIPDVFMARLVRIPDFELFIDAMVLVGELSEMDYVQNIVDTMESACESIMKSVDFKHFLKHVLQIGLFMNKGKVSGRAYGFDIFSLSELNATKAKDDSTTLLEVIVHDLTKSFPSCLDFVSGIKECLDGTQKFSISQMKDEFCTVKKKIDETQEKVNSTEFVRKEQFDDFQKVTTSDIERIDCIFKNVERLSQKVAVYFGLDEINLDDLCTCFREFCENVRKIQAKTKQERHKVASISKNNKPRRYSTPTTGHQNKDIQLLQKLAKQRRLSESGT